MHCIRRIHPVRRIHRRVLTVLAGLGCAVAAFAATGARRYAAELACCPRVVFLLRTVVRTGLLES